MLTLQAILEESHNTAREKGWWDGDDANPRNFGEQIALMHSELSEVLEESRAGRALTEIYFEPSGKPAGIAVEFADLIIRLADTCQRYEIPLEEALVKKMAYNKTRPHRHGKKF